MQCTMRVSTDDDIWEGDVGGQKTLRSYWRNYFEKTDSLIWVVDATDRFRLENCAAELAGLLQQEVRFSRS
jgi:ADP-ribosylation factor-like protein 2